jgi:hypothetical protein
MKTIKQIKFEDLNKRSITNSLDFKIDSDKITKENPRGLTHIRNTCIVEVYPINEDKWFAQDVPGWELINEVENGVNTILTYRRYSKWIKVLH